MTNEVWKDIKGYEGLYQASSLGRIKSKVQTKERILRGSVNNSGYRMVILCKNGIHKHALVHRLVADSFVPNPNGLPEVNHKDEFKLNNVASNLEWCDKKYNLNYGTYQLRKGASNGVCVNQYSTDGELIAKYKSIKEAAETNGFKSSPIQNCCCGRYKTSYGYIWRYPSK